MDGVPINDAHDNTSAQNNRISGNRDFANGASVINPDDVNHQCVGRCSYSTLRISGCGRCYPGYYQG